MTLAQMEKFIDAGFSKEEILAAAETALEQEPKTEGVKVEYKELEPKPEPEPEPVQQPSDAASEQIALLTQTLAQVTEATKALQAAAIRSTEMPEPESAGDVLAKIINPHHEEGSK